MSARLLCLDRDAIMQILPHRDPFLLVDRVEDLVPGISGCGIRRFSPRDEAIATLFTEWEVVPAMLVLEALAQTAMVVAIGATGAKMTVMLRSIPRARFHRKVWYGEELQLCCACSGRRGAMWRANLAAKANGVVVAQASIAALLLGEIGPDP